MKTYINKNTLEYPLTEVMIKSRHKNVSWPINFKPPAEYAEVLDGTYPNYDANSQYLTEGTPVNVNGEWVKSWNVVQMSPVLAQERRSKRLQNFEKELFTFVQTKLDMFARTKGYEGILSVCSYASSSVLEFKTDADKCIALRDAMWTKAFDILSECTNGSRPVVSVSTIESEFPELTWAAQ